MFRFGKRAAMSVAEERLQKPSPEEVSDEYDFCDEIAAPTMEEVEAASKELQDTLLSMKPSSSDVEAVPAQESVVEAYETVPKEVHESVFDEYEPVVKEAHESLFEEYEPVMDDHTHESVYTPVVEDTVEASEDERESMKEAEREEAPTVEAIAANMESMKEEIVSEPSPVVSQAPTAMVPQPSSAVAPSPAVAQCVELFQRNPEVQATVMSLARDPAVWDAFIKNEKVQELLRGRSRSSSIRSRPAFDGSGSSLEFMEQQHTNPFIVAANSLMDTLWDMLDLFVEGVHSVFGFLDRKLFGGQQNEPLDRPLKACMVLTVLLFSLVLLNRGRRT